jgi:hypothetical protein
MIERPPSWWQKPSKPLIAVAITIVVVGVLALVFFGYLLRLDWTGFNSGTSQITIRSASKGNYIATVSQPGKLLWDWLQLLIVPLALALIALAFQLANSRTERQLAKQRYEQDQQIALDKQREDLLQAYLDRMSELLLNEQLRTSAVDAEVRNVARVRTITLLFQLDARRIGYVFSFLRETGLMSTTSNGSLVSLEHAGLRSMQWGRATLYQADLRLTNLSYALQLHLLPHQL